MGCCTLLAIQEVRSADTENRKELDYGASADQPTIEKVGCGYRDLLPIEQMTALLKWQQESELGKHDWAFDDPRRVAADTFVRLAKVNVDSLSGMKISHVAQGRKVFEWKQPGTKRSYMVVVSRPYWLSFYSRDPNRVAWVAIAAYESSCGGRNSVTRIE